MSHYAFGIIVCSLSVGLFAGCAASGGAESGSRALNATTEAAQGEQAQGDASNATTEAAQSEQAQATVKTARRSDADVGLFGASPADDALRDSQKDAEFMLFESWPDETTLDNDFIANVVPVWLEAIESAQKTLDFEEFYAIAADGDLPVTAATQALTKIIEAVEKAAARGVKIRFIVDEKMSGGENGVLPEKLKQIPGVELRIIPYGDISGGVQHSKFFIVDGESVYFGSQNFDWRSLTQISEMGARLHHKSLVAPIVDIFEMDWALALNPKAEVAKTTCYPAAQIDYKGESTTIQTVASPKSVLPCDEMWDLPKMIDMIEGAQKSVSFQLLNYATVNYDKTTFTELDKALTDAAKRGVKVRMLVSDWSTRPKYMSDLKRLAREPNFEAKMMVIPEHSIGFVAYSRTIHSKFLVVDDDKTWLGTSNWSGDYFYNSRNVGIIAVGNKLNSELTQSFERYWNSDYAVVVDPNIEYEVKDQTKPKA